MQGAFSLATISILISKLFFYFPCDHPVTYHLGSVDPRFKLNQTAAEQDMHKATDIWGQPYFLEEPSGNITVNFVYDARQGLVTQINSQENQITADKTTLAVKVSAFNAKAQAYEQQVAALNAEIDSWNRKGGTTPDVYQQITSQIQQLNAERQSLQTEASQLNTLAKNFNLQVNQLNGTISTFNNLIVQQPEEGLFNGPAHEIDIYFVNTQAELVHTLAHEFGHSLGMNHVNNPQAIMYAFTSESLSPTTEDQSELIRACTRISKLQILLQLLKSRYNSSTR